MYNTLPLHLAPYHIPHEMLTISDIISNHTTFHVAPSFLAISHQHHSQHTIPLCNTIFQIAPLISATLCIAPHLASHFTFPIALHSMYSMPHFRSHVLATLCVAPRITPHFTQVSCTAFHILHNSIIPPHLTMITPNSTYHYHVSHNIPHHTSVHHHILHPTTCHISHNTISTNAYRAVS